LTAAGVGLVLAVLPAATAYVFVQLLENDDWASRPLTRTEGSLFDWVDGRAETGASVTMIPSPVSANFFETQQLWRDLEFWNKSVETDAHYPAGGAFRYTGIFFPKVVLRFDRATGAVSDTPTRYALQSARETRFRISGNADALEQGVLLIDGGRRWRLDWSTSGLYDDGWTKPGAVASVRIFASTRQHRARVRYLTLQLEAPGGVARRSFGVSSNLGVQRGKVVDRATASVRVRVCVPARGHADVRIRSGGESAVPSDAGAPPGAGRQGGLFVAQIALADELGGRC